MADDYELGTVGPIPTVNPNVAKIGELLNVAKEYANKYYVKDQIPLIGGTQLGDFLLGQAPEEVQRWGQGDYPVRNPSDVVKTGGNRAEIFKTGRFEPTFDVATNVIAPLAGATKIAKGGQIESNIAKGFTDEGNFRRVGASQRNLGEIQSSAENPGTIRGVIEGHGIGNRRLGKDAIAESNEAVSRIIADPQLNKSIVIAKQFNPEFDASKIKDLPGSSIEKQHPIARAYETLTEENVNPKLKQSIFDDYKEKHPELIKEHKIKSYDDLVEKSYAALRKETAQQFDAMVKNGVNMSFHSGHANYENSVEMLRDSLLNDHLYTFRGGDEHPYLNRLDPHYGLNDNEKFRAVHDYFGHGTTGGQFGRKGEEMAYAAHSQMYSPLAKIAAASETRGQNSFVNYGGKNAHLEADMQALRRDKKTAERAGEPTEGHDAALRDLGSKWQYAEQKGLALPPDMLKLDYEGKVPNYLKEHIVPKNGQEITGYHWSKEPVLLETEPSKYGTGIRGQEAKRLGYKGATKDRTYFYLDPSMKEPGLGPYQHKAVLKNSYDISADPDNLVKVSDNFNRDQYGNLDKLTKANQFERIIKEAGYNGYHDPDSGIAVSFKKQAVKPHK